jgi:hypothetical protein
MCHPKLFHCLIFYNMPPLFKNHLNLKIQKFKLIFLINNNFYLYSLNLICLPHLSFKISTIKKVSSLTLYCFKILIINDIKF